MRLLTWFPEREFIMRSQGQVRFVRITSRLQLIAAATVIAMLTLWIATISAVALVPQSSPEERQALLQREARVATAESRVAEYRKSTGAVANDLIKRQAFIEQMVEAHLGDLPADPSAGETVANSGSEAKQTVDKVSTAVPEGAGLARVEARQLAFVESLTRYADRRAEKTSAAIRKLGLNPAALARTSSAGQGGPLLRLTTSTDGSLDPRFRRLAASLARLEALERGLDGIPQVLPASASFISSGFGYRSDPFNGSAAFHAGLDFGGPIGAPIYAAADGTVTFAGQRQGYGNCIEVSHGNGLLTRYAHMSAFRTRAGQKVAAGEVIGAIGSSGRSTGPHLHFEVRINDRPVNPRPFLEARSRT